MSNINRPYLSDEINGNRAPLTIKELQERLKHIAGLCWGLSIDLTNEIESKAAIIAEFEQQETENAELRKQLEAVRKELTKCKSLVARNEVLKLENERLKQAVEMARAKSRRAAIEEHIEQLAWEREEYGAILSESQNRNSKKPTKQKTKKQLADEARAKRKAEFDKLPEKVRKRREMQRIYNKRYNDRKRAERAKGGNNET
ncbi:MAG: hypothetical protein ACI4L9_01430 [Candidatus Coproplasma sp.]